MRKLFFAVTILLSVNVIGQNLRNTNVNVHKTKVHKATGDKPLFSMHYGDYQNNDSTFYAKTTYTYNGNQQIVKEVTTDASSSVDSTVTIYDANNRITSIKNYQTGLLISEKIWIYDTVNRQIDCYEFFISDVTGTLDTTAHTIFKGVRNFDEVETSLSTLFYFTLDWIISMFLS